jgi:sugar O-acyltransferase (sialic acid O-acetyltransferase NeuD family)
MKTKKKLIIVGDSDFAQIAYEYFSKDSQYDVIAFSVEEAFLTNTELFSLPIVKFENIEEIYSPTSHSIFIALTYAQLNRVRTRLYLQAKEKGYKIANYISSRSFCWDNVKLGENIFIFEDNTIQPFVEIGNNSIFWSGNHIGHHSKIGNNCFISSHSVISGHCDIGDNSFIGVNSTIADGISIAEDNFIGLGSVINKNTEANKIYTGNPAVASIVPATKMFKVRSAA